MSVIQEENEEISPSITLLRKPRFSRHFDRNIKKTLAPRGSISSSDVEHEVIKHKAEERRKSLRSRSRRSSESSLSSSSFKVLPPIPKLESEPSDDNDKEGDRDESHEEEGEENNNQEENNATRSEDNQQEDDATGVVNEEEIENTVSSDIESLVAKNLAKEGHLKSGKSPSER